MSHNDEADEALDDQDDFEEILEIDQDGRVYKPGEAPRHYQKPSTLRDPHGEYER